VPAEGYIIEFAIQPVYVAADAAVIPVIDRIDGVNQSAVHPGVQFVIGTAATQHLDFHAMPGIGRDLGTAEPLAHRGRYVVAWNFVGAQMTLDLAEAHFIVGIRGRLEGEDVFMVVARFIAKLLAHVDHGAHMHFAGPRRQLTQDLRRVCAALEMH